MGRAVELEIHIEVGLVLIHVVPNDRGFNLLSDHFEIRLYIRLGAEAPAVDLVADSASLVFSTLAKLILPALKLGEIVDANSPLIARFLKDPVTNRELTVIVLIQRDLLNAPGDEIIQANFWLALIEDFIQCLLLRALSWTRGLEEVHLIPELHNGSRVTLVGEVCPPGVSRQRDCAIIPRFLERHRLAHMRQMVKVIRILINLKQLLIRLRGLVVRKPIGKTVSL